MFASELGHYLDGDILRRKKGEEKMFRKLRADEIEVRVGTVMKGAATLLLYKDARCDMNILDETVGAMNWQKSYQLIDGQLFCTIEIWDDEKKQWIGKQDVGVESNTEAEKGRASDAQKRAAVAAGIGRELYTAPRIKIKCETQQKSNGYGYELTNRWEFWGAEVSMIDYDENGAICALEITKGNDVIYSMDDRVDSYPEVKKEMSDMNERISQAQAQSIMAMIDAKKRDRKKFLKYYNVTDFTHLTKAQYGDALNLLNKERK